MNFIVWKLHLNKAIKQKISGLFFVFFLKGKINLWQGMHNSKEMQEVTVKVRIPFRWKEVLGIGMEPTKELLGG